MPPRACTKYELHGPSHNHPRLRLTDGEHARALRKALAPPAKPLWHRLGHYSPVEVTAQSAVPSEQVATWEQQLRGLVVWGTQAAPRAAVKAARASPRTSMGTRGGGARGALAPAGPGSPTPAAARHHTAVQTESYPLRPSPTAGPLETDMHGELEASWDAHMKTPAAAGLRDGVEAIVASIQVGRPACTLISCSTHKASAARI